MKREFLPATKYPLYNQQIDNLMISSVVLNGGSQPMPGIHTVLWDRKNIQDHLIEINGDEHGLYFRNGTKSIASMPKELVKLKEIEERYEAYKAERVYQGHEPPTEMPPEMLKQFYLSKAKIFVLELEREELQNRLNKFTEQRQKVEEDNMLAYGLQCVVKLHGLSSSIPEMVSVIKTIDDQQVTLVNGLPVISDPRSPYMGLSVVDYRRLAKEWNEERRQKEIARFKIEQERCRAEGRPVPQSPPVRSMRKVSKSQLPKWPAWAQKYTCHEIKMHT